MFLLKDVIHIARYEKGRFPIYLYLIKKEDFIWYEGKKNQYFETEVRGETLYETIDLARKFWKLSFFRTVRCGVCYTLPERDEHGKYALFSQMVLSYSSPNGVFFDPGVKHNCYVDFASQEAKKIWLELKTHLT